MDKQKEYEDFFLEVAREFHVLVFGDNSNETLLQRLRNALKNFAAQAEKHRKYMKEKCLQARKGKKAFVVTNNMQIPNKYKDPVLMFRLDRTITPKRLLSKDGHPIIYAHHQIVLSPSELNKKEAEQRDLIGLACIYDNCRVRIGKQDKINDSIVPEDTYDGVWGYISGDAYFYDGKAEFMRSALKSIQREVAKKPTEKKPDTTRAKCWRIVKKITGWIFKETWHLVVTIIGGLIVTILIYILGDFGCLERIKAFIYKILVDK
jgi:hypothetical protein